MRDKRRKATAPGSEAPAAASPELPERWSAARVSGIVVAASGTTHHWRPLGVSSACSSQYVMPISRYIVVAVVRCSRACSRLPVRR